MSTKRKIIFVFAIIISFFLIYPESQVQASKKLKNLNYIVTHNKKIMRFIGHLKILLLQKLCPMEL